ncbi:angiogenic factor with G patch and FHA domains 1-like isoform X5 [Acanthaster planci]|uniref:Angiogenic factor with G patch and FHA domains 1-like isoform X5 n=1 Tax=Acanthaster planci TaxID=133434 RepID=A0A8B7ZJC9_ACAPL|nr:angiogenic factor with G patch and FHA domains 1-like isoform X5 [Acanthaster planci]
METTMTDVEDQIGVMHSPTADLDVPRLKVKGLSEELAETKAKLATTQAELVRTEALRTEAEECSVKLRKKVEKLSQELEDLHKAAKTSISDVSCQTDPVASDVSSTEGTVAGSTGPSDWVTEVGTSGQSASQSVADSVRAAAEAATTRTGFVLDQTSGMYYDCNSGFYYDQVNKLYYDPSNGIYYYFDEGTGSYQFHSQVELPTAAQYGQGRRGKGRGNAWGKRKDRRLGEESREIDENSLTSALSRLTLDPKQEAYSCDYNLGSNTPCYSPEKLNVHTAPRIRIDLPARSVSKVLKVDYPPCIRMIVTKSDTLKPGSLFIITCAGGTIGREGSNHALLIQSVKVSKRHAHIIYDAQERQYTIVDLGSQNGTLLNGKAISEQRVVSEPHPLSHRDYITIGGTTLRLHIHPGDETCEECEPGQVQALIAQQQLNEMSAGTTSGSRPEKEQQRRKELRHLKKKYNLAKDDYSNVDPSLINPAYADRAGERRRAVGSDNPYQPDDQPASVDRAIESSNVGHKMLSKMGWTEGQSLGKGDRGIKEPIQAVVHSRNAGLGSRVVQSMDQVQYARRRNDNWDKARGRFNLTDPQQSAAANRGKKAPTWVQGGTEKLDASPQHSTADDPSSGNAFGMVQLPLAERGKADGRRRTSQGIVDIWDNSMDAGRTSWLGSSKGMEETIHSRDQQHSRDSQEKQRDDSTEYERLFLGDRAQSGNLEGATEALGAPFTADSSFKNVQLTEGSHDESKRTRQPPRGVEDRLLHSSTSTVDTDAGRVSEQIIPADSSCVGLEESNTAESSVKKTVSDGESSLTASVDSTDETSTNTPQLPTPREMRVDREQNTGGPENIDKAVQSGSLPSRISDENLEASAKKTDVKNGEQPKSVVQPSQEGTEKAKKIQLKWSKGGKEKLATSLVAFEESESDGENGDDLAGNSKSVEQEQVQQPQGEEHRASRSRRGSNKPSRWSSSRNSSGN